MLNILLSSFQAKDFEQNIYGFLLSFFKKVVYEKCFFSIAINYHASISDYWLVCFQINWRSILTSLLSSFQHQHVLYGRIPMRYQHGLSRNTMYHYITPHWILVSATQRPMQVEKHLAHPLEPRLLGDDSILTNHTMHLTTLTLLVIIQGGLNHLHHKQNFSR